ncbi:MAG: hypothetical protein NVS2B8_21550 [Vulcanimicrobiaceae bacterium]
MTPSYDAQRNEYCAYVLAESETPFGMTLGNYKTFASCTPKGGVRGLWDADSDRIIFGTHQVAYRLRDRDRTIFPHQIERNFTFLPYAQISEFALDDRLRVTECFYVPHGPRHERAVAFVVDITLHNSSEQPIYLATFPWTPMINPRFYGEPEKEVHAESDGRYLRAWHEETGATRFWGASRAPHAVVCAVREQVLQQAMRRGALREENHLSEVTPELAAYVRGRIYGAFEYRMLVAPGERQSLRIAVVYDNGGREAARATFDDLLADPGALDATQNYYAIKLSDARFLTPSPVVSRGVVWAKANMLRIIKEYPHGWGSTNSPPSDILVSRDTSWFVHGFDYFLPQFSRDAIDVFNRYLEPSGQVVEYVRGASGFNTSYDLNINDDTPLHLVAILHHYNATLDDAWVRDLLPTIVRVADYMLTQRDPNGLVWCNAKGVDMYGIASWRNIIPYYTLDGAVTEINAECVFALEAAAMLCAVAGDHAHWETYAREAETLREKMMAHLFNADTGAFVLNYDKDGNYQDNFTADEIFPVLFNVADSEQRRAILARLMESDFTTPVGLRTISTADSWYFPSHGFGLLGGIWPDLTLWFAVALARNGFENEGAHWLEAIYATMEEGARRNAVPGQYAEWFDGGSLTNRGMYMSPWTGAKYLWAVAETVCGLDGYRTSGRPHFSPRLPEGWTWTAGVRVRLNGGRCTYVIDRASETIYGDMREASAEEPYRCVYAGRDVSDELTVSPMEVGAVAFEDEGGAVRAFVCNLLDAAREVSLQFRGEMRHVAVAPGAVVSIVLAGAPVDAHTFAWAVPGAVAGGQ